MVIPHSSVWTLKFWIVFCFSDDYLNSFWYAVSHLLLTFPKCNYNSALELYRFRHDKWNPLVEKWRDLNHLCLTRRTQNPHNYFNIHVWSSLRHPILSNFLFMQSYHKMSLIKAVWYVLRVENMYPGSPSDPSETADQTIWNCILEL